MGIFHFPRSLLLEDSSAASEEAPAYRAALALVRRVGFACMRSTCLPAPTEWSAFLNTGWGVWHRSAATCLCRRFWVAPDRVDLAGGAGGHRCPTQPERASVL